MVRAEMTKSQADQCKDEDDLDVEDYTPPGMTPKMRPCLKCRTPFLSEWSGERICRKCKSTIAWRQGWS
jgi:hypothetical protein